MNREKNQKETTIFCRKLSFLFGGREWIRTTEVVDGRFTVCSLWPLGNSPIFNFALKFVIKGGAGGRTKSRFACFPCSVTVASQQYRPRTSRLKMIYQIIFLTALTLTGFESDRQLLSRVELVDGLEPPTC